MKGMSQDMNKKLYTLLTTTVVIALSACGGAVQFDGAEAIRIQGTASAPAPQPRVEVKDNKIVIHEKIQFGFDTAEILPESNSLLAEIAEVIKKNPQIQGLRIEGHASAEGSDDYNLKLSDARAKAVLQHLISNGGVSKEMLQSQGFGEQQPIADNDTEEGREANRRVEFTITKQDVTTTKYKVDPQTGKKIKLEEETETEVAKPVATEESARDDASSIKKPAKSAKSKDAESTQEEDE